MRTRIIRLSLISGLVATAANAGVVSGTDASKRELCPGASGAQLQTCLFSKLPVACAKVNNEASRLRPKNRAARDNLVVALRFSVACSAEFLPANRNISLDRSVGHYTIAKNTLRDARRHGVIDSEAIAFLKEINGLFGLSCDDWVQNASGVFGAYTKWMGDFQLPAGVCAAQFLSGFVCNVPQFIDMAWRAGKDVVQGIERHRNSQVCRDGTRGTRAMLPSALQGAERGAQFVCGAIGYAAEAKKRWDDCWAAIMKDSSTVRQVIEYLLRQAYATGCSMLGQLTFDAIAAVLSHGAAVPALLATWVKRLADFTNASTWFKVEGRVVKLGGRSITMNARTAVGVDTIQGLVQNVAQDVSACKLPLAPTTLLTPVIYPLPTQADVARSQRVQAIHRALCPDAADDWMLGECLNKHVPASCRSLSSLADCPELRGVGGSR